MLGLYAQDHRTSKAVSFDRRSFYSIHMRFGLYVAASLALLVLDSVTPLESVEWLLHLLLIWYVTVYCSLRQLIWGGVISTACIIIGGVLSERSHIPVALALVNRAVAIGAVWIMVYYSRQRRLAVEAERQVTKALEESLNEIKVLRGIIPICAACKRIRSDTGAWQQVEVYIRDHSEAEFSHGICPECARRLYPEFIPDPLDKPREGEGKGARSWGRSCS